eukprot:88932-Pyramimonas_sp.AAC.1
MTEPKRIYQAPLPAPSYVCRQPPPLNPTTRRRFVGPIPAGDLLNQYPMQPDLAPPVALGHSGHHRSKAQHDILHEFLADACFP